MFRIRKVKLARRSLEFDYQGGAEEDAMTGEKTLRDELDALKAELSHLRDAAADRMEASGVNDQIAELNRLVHQLLEDAEDTIADHPVAAVAGALALGIVIGRLTAR